MTLEKILNRTLYPLYLSISFGLILLAINQGWDAMYIFGFTGPAIALSLIALEAIFPMEKRWAMNWSSFFRDLKYIAAGLVFGRLIGLLAPFIAIYFSYESAGIAREWPLYISVPFMILAFDFFQYWLHRMSHEMEGPIGKFLWHIHVAHHLPDRVYILMHGVNNPLNVIMIRVLIMVPLVKIFGFSPETTLLVGSIMQINGAFSHFNMDIRAGVLNYVFVSTELHRYHHSADISEAKNYSAVTPFWDIVFGTFVYKPGIAPKRLGVDNIDEYPHSNDFWKVMALPFVLTKQKPKKILAQQKNS